ncbi:uncharacterized protein B0H18DRAFT_992793 [Fomitopsis serialis]|uniref:uncharacterized protein n=1 Tax=Fomitopsis serialis TaxID=139415 RepID=UPI002008631B|nr:uncharacterized protein B0H18DRAFT_992793 [Neoantrodia serialis]KAH9930649.1 hypothetical protein B0H18DRAFT_992793 [Neoantrodia serialis]
MKQAVTGGVPVNPKSEAGLEHVSIARSSSSHVHHPARCHTRRRVSTRCDGPSIGRHSTGGARRRGCSELQGVLRPDVTIQ